VATNLDTIWYWQNALVECVFLCHSDRLYPQNAVNACHLTAYCCKTRNVKDFGAFRVLQQAAVACNSSFVVLRYEIIGKTTDKLYTITQIVCQYCLRTAILITQNNITWSKILTKASPAAGRDALRKCHSAAFLAKAGSNLRCDQDSCRNMRLMRGIK